MKKMLLLSAALLAVLASPALAQPDDHGRGRGNDHGGGRAPAAAQHAAPAAPAAAPPAAPRAAPGTAGPLEQAQRQRFSNQMAQGNGNNRPDANRGNNNGRPDVNRGGNNGREDANRGGNNSRSDVNRGSNNNRSDFNRGRNNNRSDVNRGSNNFRAGARPSQRNWSQYHRAFNASRRFHYRGPSYARPSGYYYRRWNFGDFLPSLFWTSNYWINDFNYYDLPPPPPGAVWVRYGSDALLIDRFSGEIIEVEYGIFY